MHRDAQASTSCDSPKRKAQYVVFTFLTFNDGGHILVRRYRNRRRSGESLPASRRAPMILVAGDESSTAGYPNRVSSVAFPGAGTRSLFRERPGAIGDEDEGERWLSGRRGRSTDCGKQWRNIGPGIRSFRTS